MKLCCQVIQGSDQRTIARRGYPQQLPVLPINAVEINGLFDLEYFWNSLVKKNRGNGNIM